MKIEIDLDKLEKSGLTGSQYLFLLTLFKKNKIIPFLISSDELNKLRLNGWVQGSVLLDKAIALFNSDLKTSSDQFVKDMLMEMREMFPKGVTTGNKLVRSTVNNSLVARMKKFIQEYDFDKDTILKATKSYVNKCKQNDYNYMRALVYFIGKQGEGSDLADECINIKENGESGEDRVLRTDRAL